jgi:hypothetical protein
MILSEYLVHDNVHCSGMVYMRSMLICAEAQMLLCIQRVAVRGAVLVYVQVWSWHPAAQRLMEKGALH